MKLSPVMRRHRDVTFVAAGAAKGLPSVITMRTASGARRAASRAMIPPRLQPTRLTGLSAAAFSERIWAATPAGRPRQVGCYVRGSSHGPDNREMSGTGGSPESNGRRAEAGQNDHGLRDATGSCRQEGRGGEETRDADDSPSLES